MTARGDQSATMAAPVAPGATRTLVLGRNVLARNADAAARNRARFRQHGLLVVNMLSSPGAGKTELLAQTLRRLAEYRRCAVIVGDLATDHDARRLADSGAPIVQINTGSLCHLEADMIGRAATEVDLAQIDLLFIENIGNLVCPAAFDLGEHRRVVLLSVTDGEDKPEKYPVIYKSAHAVVVTKTDLAAAAGFDAVSARQAISKAAPKAEVVELSARTGIGMDDWLQLLERWYAERHVQ